MRMEISGRGRGASVVCECENEKFWRRCWVGLGHIHTQHTDDRVASLAFLPFCKLVSYRL